MISTPRLQYPVSQRRRSQRVRGPVCLPISPADLPSATGVRANPNTPGQIERVAASVSLVENYLDRYMVAQTWDLILDDIAGFYPLPFSYSVYNMGTVYQSYALELPKRPFLGVESVSVFDDYGTETVVDPATYYTPSFSDPGRISLAPGQVWPYHRAFEGFRVRYIVGYVYPFTAVNGVLTAPNHALQGGEILRVTKGTNDRLPDGLLPNADYQVTNISGDTLQLLDSAGNLTTADTTSLGSYAFLGEIPSHFLFGLKMTAIDEWVDEAKTKMDAASGIMSERTKKLLQYDRVVGI